MSLTCTPVAWENHQQWFADALASSSRLLLIAQQSDSKIGMTRFDIAKNQATVSINLAPAWRGKNMAVALLSKSLVYFAERHPTVTTVLAQIKKENVKSVKAFEKAGFNFTNCENGVMLYTLWLE